MASSFVQAGKKTEENKEHKSASEADKGKKIVKEEKKDRLNALVEKKKRMIERFNTLYKRQTCINETHLVCDLPDGTWGGQDDLVRYEVREFERMRRNAVGNDAYLDNPDVVKQLERIDENLRSVYFYASIKNSEAIGKFLGEVFTRGIDKEIKTIQTASVVLEDEEQQQSGVQFIVLEDEEQQQSGVQFNVPKKNQFFNVDRGIQPTLRSGPHADRKFEITESEEAKRGRLILEKIVEKQKEMSDLLAERSTITEDYLNRFPKTKVPSFLSDKNDQVSESLGDLEYIISYYKEAPDSVCMENVHAQLEIIEPILQGHWNSYDISNRKEILEFFIAVQTRKIDEKIGKIANEFNFLEKEEVAHLNNKDTFSDVEE
jgi:hypothetical protein